MALLAVRALRIAARAPAPRACVVPALRVLRCCSSHARGEDESEGDPEGPNPRDPGRIPKGKQHLTHMRPAIPGAWFGGERFVIMFTCNKCETRTARTVSKVSRPHRWPW
jgi:hypothetical protein